MEFKIQDDASPRLKKFLNDRSYQEFIKSTQEFNHKLVKERKFRLPFLDSQTGLAQSDCCLWMTEKDRRKQDTTGRIYSYPPSRWIKRKRQDLDLRHHQRLMANHFAQHDQHDNSSNDTQQSLQNQLHHNSNHHHHHNQLHRPSGGPDEPGAVANLHEDKGDGMDDNSIPHSTHHPSQQLPPHHNHHQNALSGMSEAHNDSIDPNDHHHNNDQHHHHHHHHHHNNDSLSSSSNSNAPWMSSKAAVDQDDNASEATIHGDQDDSIDLHNTTQPNSKNHQNNQSQNQASDQHSEQQNDRLTATNRQQAPTPTPAKKKRERKHKADKLDDPSVVKPYKCEWCGQAYKTRPGLTYHKNHCHPEHVASSASDDTVIGDESGNGHSNSGSASSRNRRRSNRKRLSGDEANHTNSYSKNGTSKVNSKSDNNNDTLPYCDFCLGDAEENKKTQKPEELISCSDCGRSGHPTCLNFTPNIISSVKKYKWQCIECKSCGLCGTSDHDDQLLFCDDCDRGYHMYCLKPPLDKPPEGSWSCNLCMEE